MNFNALMSSPLASSSHIEMVNEQADDQKTPLLGDSNGNKPASRASTPLNRNTNVGFYITLSY